MADVLCQLQVPRSVSTFTSDDLACVCKSACVCDIKFNVTAGTNSCTSKVTFKGVCFFSVEGRQLLQDLCLLNLAPV